MDIPITNGQINLFALFIWLSGIALMPFCTNLSPILPISVKTISNYVNHIFDTELDTVFKAREWKGYKITRDFLNFFRK
jgi:hypothetical protein